jgi:hypothetical protein
MSLSGIDVQIGPLTLTVHDGQSPWADEYWDEDHLHVIAEIDLAGRAWVRVAGPFLTMGDIASFLDELRQIQQQAGRMAELCSFGPAFILRLAGSSTGSIAAHLELTPDILTQTHTFELQLDQTHLPGIIRQLDTILERFPVRGRPD